MDLTESRTLEDVLKRCGAVLTAAQVRVLFIGALTSARLGLGLHHLLGDIFGPEPVLGDSLDDANANLEVLGTVWNGLVDEREDGTIRLSKVPIVEPLDAAQVAALASHRANEITWFIRGIDAGGDDPEIFGPEGRRLFVQLAEASAFFEQFRELLEKLKAPSASELERAWKTLEQLTDVVEQIVADLMVIGDELRSQAIKATLQTAGSDPGVRPRSRPAGKRRRARKAH